MTASRLLIVLAVALCARGVAISAEPGRVLFLLLDGTRADVMYRLLDQGKLPALRKHVLERGYRVEDCVSVFPSTTGPAYAPFVTGLMPEKSLLPGIRWYDRLTGRSTVYAGREYTRINQDLNPDFRTIYELLPNDNLAVFGYLDRGCSRSLMPARDLLFSKVTGRYTDMDDALYREFERHALKPGGLARFMFVSFHAPDSVGHAHGVEHPDYEQSLIAIDAHVEKIAAKLTELGAYDSTWWVVSSDHGQSSATQRMNLADHLKGVTLKVRDSIGRETFLHNLWKSDNRDGHDVHLEVSGNACVNVYAAPANSDPAERIVAAALRGFETRSSRTVDIERSLLAAPAVELVMSRNGTGKYRIASTLGVAELERRGTDYGYRVVSGGDPLGYTADPRASKLVGGALAHGDLWFEATARTAFPDAPVQIAQLLECPRAGDIVLTARPGWEPWTEGQAGVHGGLRREHMRVPLLVGGPGVRTRPMARARTVDVFPTMLEMLNLPPQAGIDGVAMRWRDAAEPAATERGARRRAAFRDLSVR
jgi:hypothetical protein